MHVSSRTLTALAATGLAAGLITTGAGADGSRSELTSRTLTPQETTIAGYTGERTATLSARITLPKSWRIVTSKSTLQTYKVGDSRCTYTVRVRTSLAVTTAADAATFALAQAPAVGPYVLDSGTRGRAAWRVTRLKTPSGTASVQLRAVGVYPRSLGSSAAGVVGAGQRAFQLITMDAQAPHGSECHSGSYRETVGPQMGDALAIARTRGYVDIAKS